MPKETKVKTIMKKIFKEGVLLADDERKEDITERAIFYPEDLVTTRVCISREVPLLLFKYGGTAKVFVSMSVEVPLEDSEIQDGIKFATNFCESQVTEQLDSYTKWLDSKKINWSLIEEQMK